MRAFLLAIALLASIHASGAIAAPDKNAVTSVADADADYQVQGEYTGVLTDNGRVGLQVVAMGKGKFDAALLRGGLRRDKKPRSDRAVAGLGSCRPRDRPR